MATKRSRAAARGGEPRPARTLRRAPELPPGSELPPAGELGGGSELQPATEQPRAGELPRARELSAAAAEALRATPFALAAPPATPFSGATGDDIFALARRHVGERYVLGARAPLGNPNWTGPWDCAELVSWCVFQVSRIVYGAEPRHDPMLADAFTGFWAAHAAAGGDTIDWREAAAIPGAAVLRKATGSLIGHIVVSDGNGGTVEAHSSARGVIEGSLANRRWDIGILVPGIRYLRSDTDPPLTPLPETIRLTRPLTRGDRVRHIQRRLSALGLSPGTPDGIYGPQTAHAVRVFQAQRGLVVDGEVGAATAAALGIAL